MKRLAALIFLSSVGSAYAQWTQFRVFNADKAEIKIQQADKLGTERMAVSVPAGGIHEFETNQGDQFTIEPEEKEKAKKITCEHRFQSITFNSNHLIDDHTRYTQNLSAGGFKIMATDRVNPYALKEAAYLVDLMLANRPDAKKAMIDNGSRLIVLGHDEFVSDVPEYGWFVRNPVPNYPGIIPTEYWSVRARGLGGTEVDPFCSCSEENLLGYENDLYAAESVMIHEFAHCIHRRGMAAVDPTFDTRLKETYARAIQKGLWKDTYAATNHYEYFAEGAQSWFDADREPNKDDKEDKIQNGVNTREELRAYDPELAALCMEVFGDCEKYSKPQTRLHGHLAGYDPKKAPRFEFPPNLKAAHDKMFEIDRNR